MPPRLGWLPNPRAAVARLVGELARRLDRPERGARTLRIRGAVVTLALAVATLAFAWPVQWLTRHYPLAWVFEAALLALLLAQRSTWSRAAAVAALGRRFARGLLGPIFWYVLLGLPGLFLQRGVQVMAMGLGAGQGGSHAGAFGLAARALDRALALPPDYLAGLILAAAAAFVPGGQPLAALGPAVTGRASAEGAVSAALAGLPALLALARLGL